MKVRNVFLIIFILIVAVSFLTFNTFHLQATVRDLEAEKTLLEQAKADLSRDLEQSNQRLRDLESRGRDGSPAPSKTAYLTFDDGPSANTAAILDILDQYQIKATFFVIGGTSQRQLDLYRRIVDEGHSLGLHGYTHDYSVAYQSVDDYMSNVYRLQDLLYETVGVRPTVARFLGGSNSSMGAKYGGPDLMQQLTARMVADGLHYFDWNVSSADTSKPLVEAQVIADTVLTNAAGRQQAVILLHDAPAKTTTVEALPQIILGLQAQGFKFEALSSESPVVRFAVKG